MTDVIGIKFIKRVIILSLTIFYNNIDKIFFLNTLSDIIKLRIKSNNENSYTKKLFSKGKARISQKVGEECVELVIASMNEDKNEVLNESADLIFHLMILLKKLDLNFTDVIDILYERNKKIKV